MPNRTGGAVSLNFAVFTPPGHQASDSRSVIVVLKGSGQRKPAAAG
jgi:hypothetical protein